MPKVIRKLEAYVFKFLDVNQKKVPFIYVNAYNKSNFPRFFAVKVLLTLLWKTFVNVKVK